MPLKRHERERMHELRKEQTKNHEGSTKHHASRGGF